MKITINALRRVQFAVLFVILLIGGAALVPAAVTNVWNAAGPDGFWTNSANWTNLAGVATVPATNDVLVFTGSTQVNTTNNYTNAAANLTFSGIVFDANAGAFNLYGSTITPGGGFTNNSASTETVTLPVSVTGGPANTPRPFNVIQAGGNLVFNGVISGATNITKTGPGTVTLNATNTFTGGLTVAGTLTIGTNGELNSGAYAGAITNNGTINYTGLNAQTLSGLITNSAAGIINLNGAVAQTLSGTITNNGSIAVGAGTPTISGTVNNNGSVTFNTTNAATLSATLSGAGSVVQGGVNTLTLSGNSPSYTGTVAINAGELISTTGSVLGGTVTVASGATNAVQVSASGGQAVLGGLTYASGTTYLALNINQALSSSAAPLQINGNLAINGTLNIALNTNGSVALSAGAFPLIKYTGTLSGTPPAAAFALPAGLVATIVNNTANKSIDLDITAGGNQVTWAVGSGNWDFSTPNWTFKSPSQPNFSAPAADYSDGEFAVFEDVLSGAGPIAVTLNTTVNPTNVLFNNSAKNYSLSGTGSISGPTGVTKQGSEILSISSVQNYTGATTLDGGTTILDLSGGAASGTGGGIIQPTSALVMAGGSLNVIGNPNGAIFNDQAFASTAFNSGPSTISVGGNNPAMQVDLGTLTEALGGTVVFNGPATDNGPSTAPNPVPATGVITTATTTATYGSLISGSSTQSGYATVGAYDWAATSGSGPATIVGGSQIGGFYTAPPLTTTAGLNYDIQGNVSSASSTTSTISLRYNTPGAATFTVRSVTDGAGILITPNVGANNITFVNNTSQFWCANRNGANRADVFWQNNTNGLLIFNCPINDTSTAPDQHVQAGPGTVVYDQPNGYTGQTYLNGGIAEISGDAYLGPAATAAIINLNGGTVLANGTFTMDNSGANKRPFALGFVGGGLAVISNNVLTVDGVISGSIGTGPLAIGIPASSANGNVAGLVPGTGPNTANAATNAVGTVVLTGANTYTGGTVIYSGALSFTTGTLGTGPVTLNGGTLRWPSGNAIDVSAQGLVVGPNGGILDLNGDNVTLAGTITGSGAMVITNGTLTLSGANTYSGGTVVGTGSTLVVNNTSGSATGSGSVTVQSGATVAGPGSIAGSFIVQRGGTANPGTGVGTLTVGSLSIGPLGTFISPGANFNFEFNGSANDEIVVSTPGGLSLNGGAIGLNQAGSLFSYATPGTYNLIQYSGTLAGTGLDSTWTTSSADNPHVANPQVGFKYSFGTSGGFLTVTIAVDSSAVNATWITDADGNWSTPANWSSNPQIPSQAGHAATFGVGTALRTVTLDANETVGVINFTNTHSFVIAGASTLTLDKNGAGAKVNVQAGANTVQDAVSLNDNVQFNLGTGQSVTLSGSVANTSTAKVLAVTGSGTLALSGANTYGPATSGSFGTVIGTGATLQVGNNTALGAGDVEFAANGTLQAASGVNVANNIDVVSTVTGTVDTQANTMTLSGVVSDNGTLGKTGSGVLNLTGANTYTGGTAIKGGAVNVTADGNLGAVTPVTLNGGSLEGTGVVALNPNRNIAIGPAGGATGTNGLLDATSGSSLTVQGSIGSAGNLGQNGLLVNSLAGSSAGTVFLEGPGTFTGNTSVANGILQLVGNANGANTTDNQSLAGSAFSPSGNGALVFDSSLTTATFGGLTGSGFLALTNSAAQPITLTLAGNVSNRFLGGLYDAGLAGNLTKNGAATFTIAGSNNYIGRTSVNNGTLEVAPGGILNVGALSGQGYLVDGGTISNATNTISSLNTVGNAYLQTAGNVALGELTYANNDGALLQVNGGVFSSYWLRLLRANDYATAPTPAAPIAALTTSGFYINSTNTLQPAQINLGQLSIAADINSEAVANSSASLRMDAGTMTVTNSVYVGGHMTTGRYSILQINGGRFTNLDTVNGVILSQNTTVQNDSEVLFSGNSSNFVQMISFGLASDTSPGIGDLIITNSTLFVGSGGINMPNTTGLYTPNIWLETGVLGASADWTSTISSNAATTGWSLPLATSFTIQAADATGVAHNITINGGVSGAGSLVKTGGGILTLSGTNSWTGTTAINAGTLALNNTPYNTVLLSPTITLGGGTFDISSATIGLNGQTLQGSGVINGSLSASNSAKLYAGLPGAYGTNTFNNNLTLGAGVSAYLALGLTNTGAAVRSNGLFVVTGNLSLNGNSIHITAPNTTSNLDNTTDYVLFNVAGTITGTAASTPIWDVRPVNAANFSVVTLAHSVVLRFYSSSSLPPSGVATVNPINLYEGQTATITATVTNGSNPSISSVVLYETPIGGGAAVPLTFASSPSAGVSNYSVTINIPTSFPPSAQTLSVIVTDGAGEEAVLPVAITVFPGHYWTGSGADNNWSTSANWLGNVAPSLTGDAVTFAGTTRLSPSMDQGYNLNGLSFDPTAGAFTLTSPTSTLIMSGGITNGSTQGQVVNIPIQLASAAAFSSAAGSLSFGQMLDNGGFELTFTGSNNISVSGGIQDTGGLTKNGAGTLTLTGANGYSGDTIVSAGTLAVNNTGAITPGALVTVGNTASSSSILSISGGGSVTANGAGTFSVAVGSVANAAGDIRISGSTSQLSTAQQLELGAGNGGYGAMSISGGTVSLGNYLVVGFNNDRAVLNQTGGALSVTFDTMTIGAGGTGSIGVANFSGGAFADTSSTLGGIYVGELGVGVLNISGTASVQAYGATNVTLGRTGASSSGTLNLNGGTLLTSQVSRGAGTGVFDFNGGILVAVGGNPLFMTNLTSAYVYSNNAIIDDGGSLITIGQPLLAPTGSGVIAITVTNGGSNYIDSPIVTITGNGSGATASAQVNAAGVVTGVVVTCPGRGYSGAVTVAFSSGGGSGAGAANATLGALVSGGLVKVDTGTLTLTGSNTYSGSTVISNGTLALVQGSSINFSTNIDVTSTAILDVTGFGRYTNTAAQTIKGSGHINGNLLINGTLSAGEAGAIGTLNLNGSLTLSNKASFRINKTSGVRTSDLATGMSSASYGGTLVVNNTGTDALAVGDTFTLFNASSATGNFTNITGGGATFSFTPSTGVLTVTSTVSLVPTNMTFSVSSGNLNIAWPADHLGWSLQSNSINIGVPADWFTISGSSSVTNLSLPIQTNKDVYYRMMH